MLDAGAGGTAVASCWRDAENSVRTEFVCDRSYRARLLSCFQPIREATATAVL